MRTLPIVLALTVVLAPIAGTAVTATESTTDTTIEILVQTPEGEAVGSADVTVTLDNGDSKTDETFSNGKVLFDVPELSALSIDVEHPDYVLNQPREVENPAQTDRVNVTVYPEAQTEFQVTNTDGEAVEDARVTMVKEGSIGSVVDARTGADGTLGTEPIESGSYRVTVEKAGHFRESYVAEFNGSTTEEPVTIEQGSVTVDFRVVDPQGGSDTPIRADVSITRDGEAVATVRTDSDGSAGIKLAVNANFRITVEKDGYETTTQTLRVNEEARSLSLNVSRTPSLSASARNDRVVVGESTEVVVTDEYGERVANATVLVDGEPAGETGPDGILSVTVESAGNVTIAAREGDVESPSIVVEGVEAGNEVEQTTAASGGTTMATTEAPDDGFSIDSVPRDILLGVGGIVLALLLVIAVLLRRGGGGGD